ncbi:MAG: hypothetical protein J0H85_02385 [Sediminibacterium magnilacihabitans]|jgi:hypothetical protein|nr:hypothetical protein [Sediminibacterium magnilacihabitans]PQV62275.1 hypothetical protein CLV53_101551 [Sediminibacterium magnilacihabitans]
MKSLAFLSRLALICNLLFIVCLIIQRTHDFIGRAEVSHTIIVLGWFIAPFLNLLVHSWYGIRLIKKEPVLLPKWLIIVNLSVLFLQFFIFFILP